MKIICAGDLHIGRRPSRLPAGVDSSTMSAAVAWDAIVDQAVQRDVDLVALSGDVVDRDNRFYEAIGPLERGLRRLKKHGIDTVAVAGNHDFDVLPRLAGQFDDLGFRLLGKDGRWERHVIERDGKPVLEVHGWSFPALHVSSSPLNSYDLPTPAGVPALGLLHTDLDQSNSGYAPTTMAELRRIPVSAWLIGHVHAPRRFLDARPIVLNPGSPQALDPGETGPHGAWLMDLSPGVAPSPEGIPLSRVRYDVVKADLTGVSDPNAIGETVNEALDAYVKGDLKAVGPLRHALVRLLLTGRTSLHGDLESHISSILDIEKPAGDATVRIEKVVQATHPEIVLQDLASARNPAGRLAAMLLDLQSDSPSDPARGLLLQAQEKVASVNRASAYAGIPDRPEFNPADPPGYARDLVVNQGLLLLEQMLMQKEARP